MLSLLVVALFALLLAPICGGMGYYISAEKGRGGIDGAIFGLLLGPLGLLLAVLMPDPSPARRAPFPTWGVVLGFALLDVMVYFAGQVHMRTPAASPGIAAAAPEQVKGREVPGSGGASPSHENESDSSLAVVGGVLVLGAATLGLLYYKWGPAKN